MKNKKMSKLNNGRRFISFLVSLIFGIIVSSIIWVNITTPLFHLYIINDNIRFEQKNREAISYSGFSTENINEQIQKNMEMRDSKFYHSENRLVRFLSTRNEFTKEILLILGFTYPCCIAIINIVTTWKWIVYFYKRIKNKKPFFR